MRRRTFRARAALSTVGALLALLAAPGPAGAADGDDGLWYYTGSGMAQLHERSTGEGITIAILDSQIDSSVPDLVGTNLEVHEPSYCAYTNGGAVEPATRTGVEANHGTGVTSMILGTGAGINGEPGVLGVAPGATVLYYAVNIGDSDPGSTLNTCQVPGGARQGDGDPDELAFRQAIADGADIISISNGTIPGAEAVAEAQQAGVVLVASAGNSPGTYIGGFAGYNGVLTVGSITSDVQLWEKNPSGPLLAVNAPGVGLRVVNHDATGYMRASGSSLAAPYTAGVLALAWSLHPAATANQMVQSLLHTTGGSTHEMSRDDAWGYGVVNARQLLEVDPASYPDDNPLLVDDPDRRPTRAQVLGLPEPTPTPTTTAEPSASPTASGTDTQLDDDSDTGGSVPVGLLVGGGALVAVAAITTVVLLRRRTSTDNHTPGAQHG